MATTIDGFWELLDEIQGETTELTDSLKAIAKNEKTVAENLFSNIIDQIAYNSQDYQRLRGFLRDWYAAHRSITTYQANISDIYQMPNDQLDNLFQSFGYDLSSSLKNPVDNNPPLNKINFFLDLVNLYKKKGSPSALLSVLQYYGLANVDIYELALQFDDRPEQDSSDIIFKGKIIAGTSGDTSPIYLNFDLLTQNDPHWFQSEENIKQLFLQNKINFPSQSPYFAVKPIFDEEATDGVTGILQRQVQDQYAEWQAGGGSPEDTTPILDQNAIISATGDICSLLTLYLTCIYIFQQLYSVGFPADRFVCYDGTNTLVSDILDEFRDITGTVDSRDDQKARLAQYYDTFTRDMTSNFLINVSDAENYLTILNPTVKANIDSLTMNKEVLLGTLLRDLGEWIRANISYGFINISYILFGIDSLFGDLRKVIEFFKPYRARIIPLELLEFSTRLFNSIIVEDQYEYYSEIDIHDFITGDSTACCSDSTCTALYYAREYYDCGSNHDIGAVVDQNILDIYQINTDYLACPHYDTTGYVTYEVTSTETGDLQQTINPDVDSTSVYVSFSQVQPDDGYAVIVNMFNEDDGIPSIYAYTVTNKSVAGFTLELSGAIDSANYYITWDISDQTNVSGIQPITNGTDEVSVAFSTPRTNTNYSIALTVENSVDANPSQFLYTITDKTVNGFTVKLSDSVSTANYAIGWITSEYGRSPSGGSPQEGWQLLSNGSTSFTIPFSLPYEIFDNYNVSLTIVNTDGTAVSNYGHIVTNKDTYGFSVLLSDAIDSDNYYISWTMPLSSNTAFEDYIYRQTGQIRDFDTEGTFDCTHGFDECTIEIETSISYLIQENGDLLLQEDGSGLLY